MSHSKQAVDQSDKRKKEIFMQDGTALTNHRITQSGERAIIPPMISLHGTGDSKGSIGHVLESLQRGAVLMMGDNPALPRLPEAPTLMDFLRLRIDPQIRKHLLQSAAFATKNGHPEKVVFACLVHDIGVGMLVNAEHGFWGAQLIEPYVDPEVAFAIRFHQPLRYFADEAMGYPYPEQYKRLFGEAYEPPPYVHRLYEQARAHRWYESARILTLNDEYSWEPETPVSLEDFEDVIGRNFRQPSEGLGFDNSPAAHMWRTLNWPNNSL
jgi:hypothetical protein